MNGSRRKTHDGLAWGVFVASYLLVWLLVSIPVEQHSDQPARPEALVAGLGSGKR